MVTLCYVPSSQPTSRPERRRSLRVSCSIGKASAWLWSCQTDEASAMCEKQIMTPSSSILYCSEAYASPDPTQCYAKRN